MPACVLRTRRVRSLNALLRLRVIYRLVLPSVRSSLLLAAYFVSGSVIACLSDTLAPRCLVRILHILNKPLTGGPRMSGPTCSGLRDVRPLLRPSTAYLLTS